MKVSFFVVVVNLISHVIINVLHYMCYAVLGFCFLHACECAVSSYKLKW